MPRTLTHVLTHLPRSNHSSALELSLHAGLLGSTSGRAMDPATRAQSHAGAEPIVWPQSCTCENGCLGQPGDRPPYGTKPCQWGLTIVGPYAFISPLGSTCSLAGLVLACAQSEINHQLYLALILCAYRPTGVDSNHGHPLGDWSPFGCRREMENKTSGHPSK